jgi:Protein of unknown function (DUF2971)
MPRKPATDLAYCDAMWTDDFVKCLEESTVGRSRVEEAAAIKEQHLPKRVYKFRFDNKYSRDNLQTDTVWMASPETYNDPYDSSLSLPVDTLRVLIEAALVDRFVAAAKLEKFISSQEIENAKKGPRPLERVLESIQLSKPVDAFLYWRQKAESYSAEVLASAEATVSQLTAFRKLSKVCSFSEVNDSLLMWSHYANHHRGFCVEYSLESLGAEHFFRKNLYPVVYSKDLYDLRPFMEGLTAGSREELKVMLPLVAMLHKFDGWGYEREWRLVSETEAIEVDRNRPTPPSGVLLGARFDPSTGKELLAICRGKRIPISQMIMAKDKFALSPYPFPM